MSPQYKPTATNTVAFSLNRYAAVVAVLALSIMSYLPAAEAAVELDPADRPSSLSGSYLAGRSADISNDIDAALAYLTYTLEADRGNPVLGDRVLSLQIAAGEIEPALDLAERLTITDPDNPTARIALAASAIKNGRYALAKQELENVRKSPLTTLTSGLLRAWADQGLGRTDEALTSITALTGPTWYEVFKDFHRALIADAAGRNNEADAAITGTYENENVPPVGIVDAYARIKARNGDREEALRALNELSGGEQQLVGLASALAQRPEILLLDEPTAFLDLAHQLQIYQILRELHRKRNSTLILVTHDLNLAESFCSRVVFLKEGRIEAEITKDSDSSDPLITPELVQEVFGVESQIISDGTNSRVILSYGD